jgi:AcrR family transcriptional regulator
VSRSTKSAVRLDPEVRRAQLLAAATAVAAGRDPSELSFDEIADAAGVSRSLLYAYFGDRGGLVGALYEHHLAALDEHLGSALDGPPDHSRVRQLVRRSLTFGRDHPDAWHVITSAGTVQHPAAVAARRARVARVAASWGGGEGDALLVRGVLAMLEAACQEWLEIRDRPLARATEVIAGALWSGLASCAADGRPDASPAVATSPA